MNQTRVVLPKQKVQFIMDKAISVKAETAFDGERVYTAR